MDSAQLTLDDYAAAQAKRDAAIVSVTAHADENCPKWSDRAKEWIRDYAKKNRTFISEQCTEAAYASGLPHPHDPRAWGGPFQSCARQKIIVKTGYGVSKNRNCSPTPLWQSNVFNP